VLLIGKSQRVLDDSVAGLRDLSYEAEATNHFADATSSKRRSARLAQPARLELALSIRSGFDSALGRDVSTSCGTLGGSAVDRFDRFPGVQGVGFAVVKN
jgi:hypothetical protein